MHRTLERILPHQLLNVIPRRQVNFSRFLLCMRAAHSALDGIFAHLSLNVILTHQVHFMRSMHLPRNVNAVYGKHTRR